MAGIMTIPSTKDVAALNMEERSSQIERSKIGGRLE